MPRHSRRFLIVAFALYLSSPLNAVADQLGIGGLRIGMNIDNLIKGKEVNCRIGGMIFKTIKCYGNFIIDGVQLKSELNFDTEHNQLHRIFSKFDNALFDEIKDMIDKEYVAFSNSEANLYSANNIIIYTTESGCITLKYKESDFTSSIHIISSTWQQKYDEVLFKLYLKLEQ